MILGALGFETFRVQVESGDGRPLVGLRDGRPLVGLRDGRHLVGST